MTNLLILVPEVPQEAAAVATSDAWGTSIRLNELNNNRCGERYNLAALNTAKTGTALISYDVGASKTKTIDHLAIARADLLANDSTTGVLVRGARQSRFAPSTISGLKLWLDANLSVTTVAGAVSQVDDITGLGGHATQGTANKRPYLSSAGNKENETSYSNAYTNSEWNKAAYSVTAVDNFTTNYLGQSTAGKITAIAGTGIRGVINASGSLHLPVGGQVVCSVDVKKSNYSYLWIGDQSDSPWHGVTFNLDTGAFIGNGNLLDSKSVVSLGSGWYRVSVTYTSSAGHNPSAGVWFSINADRTSPPSFTAAGTEEFYLARASLGRTSTDTTYFDTTDAVTAGVNSNRTIIFDGSNDGLGTAYAANTSAGFTVAFNTIPIRVNVYQGLVTSYIGATADRFDINVNASGAIEVYFRNGGANFIGRKTANTVLVIGTSAQIVVTYDGTTVATGIKIYLNGTQVDNATLTPGGAYTVPAASGGKAVELATRGNGLDLWYRGYINEVMIYERELGTTDRQTVEQYLIDKWTLPAIVGDFSFAANAGQNTEDYLDTFTTSSAFRYWWVELTNNASKKFTHSKLFIGQSVDLGDTIDSISCVKEVQASTNFESSAGSIDSSKSYDDPYIVRITWKGVTDTQINDFATRVGKNNAARKGMFLATVDNHDVLDGLKCIYVKLKSYSVNDQIKNNYNSLTAEFEEIVG